MRLLEVGLAWPPGFPAFIFGRLDALAKAGVEIVASAPSAGPTDRRLLPGCVQVIRLPHSSEPRASVLLRAAALTLFGLIRSPVRVWRLCRIGWKHNPRPRELAAWWIGAIPYLTARADVIHFEWPTTAANNAWLPEFLGIPYVVSCRGRQINVLPHVNGKTALAETLRQCFQGAAAVHGVCRDILDQAQQFGADPRRSRVVYTAVDLDFFRPPDASPLPREPGRLRLISVGVAIWRKGFEYLLMAVRQAVDEGLDLELAIADFNGPEQERIRYTAEDLGIADRVHILGRLDRSGVREQLWKSDVFVHAALSEGLSNAVVEAMACGLPVVTTDCGGMREAVTDGVEGCIVPVRNPQAIASALALLGNNPALRERMGTAARQKAERDFSPERQAREFIALYEGVLAAA